ncbi:MAG: sugar ABC transporter permease [Deltaproteobacteria bacterium]|nr:sugar ABC transporter permease [Deltaproteobacteria bacterium]MBW2421210.1 sugar ABC transporter permease [Deltaproteobacteria bacterium]
MTRDTRFAWLLCAPALLVILAFAFLPLAWTIWDSLHLHDLRMPWRGRPFVGFANYAEALAVPRFWQALAHTAFFAVVSVALELLLGLLLALGLHQLRFGRGPARTAALLPWAIPTVVSALLWRFLFDGSASPANATLAGFGVEPRAWFSDAMLAWVPIILADVWKTTPFVALLLLAGLQNIDDALEEAARVDGAGAWRRFVHVTLPCLRPALLVALVFRLLDAFRVFDLIYVLTTGGPGSATEPIALLAFQTLFEELRFGYGAALSILLFAVTSLLAFVYIRLVGSDLLREER